MFIIEAVLNIYLAKRCRLNLTSMPQLQLKHLYWMYCIVLHHVWYPPYYVVNVDQISSTETSYNCLYAAPQLLCRGGDIRQSRDSGQLAFYIMDIKRVKLLWSYRVFQKKLYKRDFCESISIEIIEKQETQRKGKIVFFYWPLQRHIIF